MLAGAQPTACWLWEGGRRGRYGKTKCDGAQWLTHRLAYTLVKGPIPEGLQLDHLCRTPLCFNPLHLEAVTARVNSLRSSSVAAKNAVKTHCKRGHSLSGRNLYVHMRDGHPVRSCRTCRKDTCREYDRAKRSERHLEPAVMAYRREFKRQWRAKRRAAGLPVL